MKKLLAAVMFMGVFVGTLPVLASDCAPPQATLSASHACCASSMGRTCAAVCARKNNGQRLDLRASATEPTLKMFSNTIASHDLTAPTIQLALAGSSTETSPAPIPRRYLRTHTLRL